MEFTPLLLQKFWSRVKVVGNCWEWQGGIKCDGYGSFYWNKKYYPSHRVCYEIMVGLIPIGLQLDHLCRNRKCCNPDHLEPVTRRENILRGDSIVAHNSQKTHCPQKHEYTPENTWKNGKGSRVCRICHNESSNPRRV